MDQRLDRLLDIKPFEAGLAHREMVPDRVPGSGVELVVQEVDDLLEEVSAVAGGRLAGVACRVGGLVQSRFVGVRAEV